MTTPTYSPQEMAWQLIVAAALDDDPRDDTTTCGPDELDQLMVGMDDDRTIMTLCAAAGMAGRLVVGLAEARGTTTEELVKQLGAGLAEEF